MEEFLTDRWHDIISLNSAQWFVLLDSRRRGRDWAFYLFNWLYSQRLTKAKEIIDLQNRYLEVYAGKPPLSLNLDQAIDFIETELQAWKHGQKGAKRGSAALVSVYNAKLLEVYSRLYEHLQDQQQRDNLLADKRLGLHSGPTELRTPLSLVVTLAPLEYNKESIEATKERISELETRLKPFEQPHFA